MCKTGLLVMFCDISKFESSILDILDRPRGARGYRVSTRDRIKARNLGSGIVGAQILSDSQRTPARRVLFLH